MLSIQLPLSTWVFYAIVYLISLEYFLLAFGKSLRPHWRAWYIYVTAVFSTYSLYITLRLTHTLDTQDFRAYVGWLAVGLGITLIWPGIFIHWEKTFYKRAMEKRMPLP